MVISVNYKRNKRGVLLQLWCNVLVSESGTLFLCALWTGTLPQAALHFRTLMGDKPIHILTNSFEISGEKCYFKVTEVSIGHGHRLSEGEMDV